MDECVQCACGGLIESVRTGGDQAEAARGDLVDALGVQVCVQREEA